MIPGTKGSKIDLLIDQPWGPSIGSIEIPGKEDIKKWNTFTAKIKGVKGVHALWLKFSVKDNDSFKINWFNFGNGNQAAFK